MGFTDRHKYGLTAKRKSDSQIIKQTDRNEKRRLTEGRSEIQKQLVIRSDRQTQKIRLTSKGQDEQTGLAGILAGIIGRSSCMNLTQISFCFAYYLANRGLSNTANYVNFGLLGISP